VKKFWFVFSNFFTFLHFHFFPLFLVSEQSSISKYPSPIVVDVVRLTALFVSKIFWRIEYAGKENIPRNSERGLLIVANHQTYFDPFWIGIPVKRKLRFMAWDAAFEWFLIGRLIRYLGAFPVNLERGSPQSYRQAIKFLREGANLFIFPEGSREFSDGDLLPFKSGAVKIALQADVPILPVTVSGANKIWAQDMKYPRPGKVKIIFHPLIEVTKPSAKAVEKYITIVNDRLVKTIESGLDDK
jgi:1-acyl-sn-glycerol-3-phosphate acyltransferase